MDRKDRILSYIISKEYIPLKLDELMAVLDVPSQAKGEFLAILDELAAEGRIFVSKRGRYMPVSVENGLAAGRIMCSARGHFAFLLTDDDSGDIFIAGERLNGALNGDTVLVSADGRKSPRGHREGGVIKVLHRANTELVGVVRGEKGGRLRIEPDDRRIYADILAPVSDIDAEIGERVVVSSIKYGSDGRVYGEITALLGEENSIKSCLFGIIADAGIKREFDEKTLSEAGRIADTVTDAQILDREDLRDMLIFTIDGDDAKDFDDAVSAEITDGGNYNLGVHIADVTEYVKEGGALDSEAYERGTSVYLPGMVIPMLPERLSNGICSLNPDTDRLTLSVFMEISPEGRVISHRLVKSVIRSRERMTYNNVNKILEENDAELCERYAYMLPTLRVMEKLAAALNKNRVRRGAIQFDFPEIRVITDENGDPVSIEKEIRGTSNKMIEEFMLSANETVAEYAYWSEIPFVYRSHEPPSPEKIKEFNEFITRFGLSIRGKIDKDNPVKPKALQKILDDVKDAPEERIISSNMLRSLMKARYSADNLGHFGLAAKYYCHFTSPIRRYPDLAVHRILKKLLDGGLDTENTSYLRSYTCAAALHSSECETGAERAERDADDLMKAAYMSQFIGGVFDGIIANVTSFGMFVELENGVEGLVRAENMTDDYYDCDETAGAVTGRKTGRTYSTGDSVAVVVARCDILARQIDFVLDKDADTRLLNRLERKPDTSRKINRKKHRGKKQRYGKI